MDLFHLLISADFWLCWLPLGLLAFWLFVSVIFLMGGASSSGAEGFDVFFSIEWFLVVVLVIGGHANPRQIAFGLLTLPLMIGAKARQGTLAEIRAREVEAYMEQARMHAALEVQATADREASLAHLRDLAHPAWWKKNQAPRPLEPNEPDAEA